MTVTRYKYYMSSPYGSFFALDMRKLIFLNQQQLLPRKVLCFERISLEKNKLRSRSHNVSQTQKCEISTYSNPKIMSWGCVETGILLCNYLAYLCDRDHIFLFSCKAKFWCAFKVNMS